LDYEALENETPRLVMASITPFGQHGPYSGYKGEEIVAYAMGGIMGISGTSDREPLKHGGFQAQYEAALNGALSTAFALLLRDFTDEGQHVDVSIQEVVNSTLVINQPYYSWSGAVQGRRRAEGTTFGHVMPCKDGYFVAQPGGGAAWEDVVDFFGREELKEERFADAEQRAANGRALDDIIIEATKDRTMAEIFKTGSEKYRMLLGMVQTPEDLANCAQLEARGFFQHVDHPVMGELKVPFTLMNMTESASKYRMPAPLLGQHNEEVYAQLLGYTHDDVARLRGLGVI
jgi:crotonobetainyl-CoA:carnitine CoA-transferase CaiB-like acyl-CoA transferase